MTDLLTTLLDEVRAALERHADRNPLGADSDVDSAPPQPRAEPEIRQQSDPTDEETGQVSRLAELGQLFHLTDFELRVLVLCAGIELDASFPPLCAKAQVDPKRAYPTFGLALAALADADWQALLPQAPLRSWNLLQLDPTEALTTSPLRIDEHILHYLLGFDSQPVRLAALTEPVPEDRPALVPSQQRQAEHIAAVWRRTRGSRDFPVVELCGENQGAKRPIAAEACRQLGLSLQAISAESLPTAPEELESLLRLWHRESLLAGAALLIEGDQLRPDDPREGIVRSFLDRSRTAMLVTRRSRLTLRQRTVLSLEVDKPLRHEQRDLWQSLVQQGEHTLSRRQLIGLADQFHLGSKEIRSIWLEALGRLTSQQPTGDESSNEPTNDDSPLVAALWQTCRERVRPTLADLAQHLEPKATWDDLVLPEVQLQTLRQISIHLRQRGTVHDSWGFSRKSSRGLGIHALFSGSSGTGKTMAAEVLAGDLGLDLFRIDLSSVVSKYIGETEKNLERVFTAAEAGGSILLFDEADALFGRRGEVKDSHDRYANMEVSYLLQRIESYRGLAILTTNLRSSLDTAFQRRLEFIVEFPFPTPVERAAIWRKVFPREAPTDELHYERLARVNLSGGHIRNIALNAAFLAAEDVTPVNMRHLLIATRRELTKLNRSLPETEVQDWLA